MVSVKPLIVHWHQDSTPIYGSCFQPKEKICPSNRSARLITAGGDNNIRVWRLKLGRDPIEPPQVEYYSTLAKHERAVNTVEFDPSGQVLATAGDDGVVCLWALNENAVEHQPFGADHEDLETWRLVRKCRTASFGEIYDLAWSPSGQYLAATSMDKIVSILDSSTGACIASLRDHRHYVQGVAWDPKDEYLATQSSDQRVLIYKLSYENKKLNISAPIARLDKSELGEDRTASFHSESFASFFRRLAFSPDGALLVIPACQIDQSQENSNAAQPAERLSSEPPSQSEQSEQSEPQEKVPQQQEDRMDVEPKQPEKSSVTTQNCAMIYARNDLKTPVAVLPLPKPSTVVKFCPLIFKRNNETQSIVDLPYRMVFAVATMNSVFIYDTERTQPLAMASNLHYSTITDLSWSPDGKLLLLTSIDGFCSVFRFETGELGEVREEETKEPESTPSAALATEKPRESNVINTLMVRKKPKVAPTEESAPKTDTTR